MINIIKMCHHQLQLSTTLSRSFHQLPLYTNLISSSVFNCYIGPTPQHRSSLPTQCSLIAIERDIINNVLWLGLHFELGQTKTPLKYNEFALQR